jgi:hypothetical protein
VTDARSEPERFEAFHEANPIIYMMLVDRCRQWAATGRTSFGLRQPWERLRWDLAIHTTGEPYKLNDHHVPYYARMIVACEPDLATMLALRRADEADAWAAERFPEMFGTGGAA